VVGLASDGLHTNGYSLARRALFDDAGYTIADRPEALAGASIADALLAPHRWYGPAVDAALGAGRVRAMAHVTGGGIAENLARVLPSGAGAVIRVHGGQAPPLFKLIAEAGAIGDEEMRRVFNLGVGFCVVVPPEDEAPVCRAVRASGTDARVVGEIVAGEGVRWSG
jgi:phosphoribosylformylglycinamidine cyclo-ligase